MKKKYIVRLNAQERSDLVEMVRHGKAAAYRRTHAEILLSVDEGTDGMGLDDIEAAKRCHVNHRTVSRLRQRLVEHGFEAALERAPRHQERRRVLDGQGEAQLVALMCSSPPEGQARWTLNLACKRIVELGIVESVSHETVRQVLKKHSQTLA